MDVFMEYLLSRKKDSKDIIIMAAIIAAGILLSLIVVLLILMFVNVPGVSSIGLLLIAGVWYGAVILMRRRNIEWEYILTNSYFDIDKIMAKSSRKRVLSIDFKDAALVAAVDDDAHNYEFKGNQTSKNVKIMDFTGGKNVGETYFIDIRVNGERRFVIFQPTSKMIEAIKNFNPRNVFIKE